MTDVRFLTLPLFIIPIICQTALGQSLIPPHWEGSGGVILTHPILSINHLYSDKPRQCSDLGEYNENYFFDASDQIAQIIESMQQIKTCRDMSGLLEIYRQELYQVDKLHDENFNFLTQNLKNRTNHHEEYFLWAYLSSMTSAATQSRFLKANWNLYLQLIEIQENNAPLYIRQQGEKAESCHNVVALGDEDLDHFFVNTKGASKVEISYETYAVADAITVKKKGNKIIDSGCVRTSQGERESFNMSVNQIRFEVDAKCAGDPSSIWRIEVKCDAPKPEQKMISQKCQENLDQVKQRTLKFIDDTKKSLDHFWAQAVCYEDENHIFLKSHPKLKHIKFQIPQPNRPMQHSRSHHSSHHSSHQ